MYITERSKILGFMPHFSFIRRPLYSKKFNKRIRDCYAFRYAKSLREDFAKVMTKKTKKYQILRLHLLGDFYSQEYLDKWITIAKNNPLVIYYTYLRYEWEYELDYSQKPENLFIITINETRIYSDNVVYTSEFTGNIEKCPKIHCSLCLKCLKKFMVIGNKKIFLD